MPKSSLGLPDMRTITVEDQCPLCGQLNWIGLESITASDSYECNSCSGVVQVSTAKKADLQGRIARKFADAIRTC